MGDYMKFLFEDAIPTVRTDIRVGLCDSSTMAHFDDIVQGIEKLVEAAQYATCEKCDHNRCQGLRDALKGLV